MQNLLELSVPTPVTIYPSRTRTASSAVAYTHKTSVWSGSMKFPKLNPRTTGNTKIPKRKFAANQCPEVGIVQATIPSDYPNWGPV